MTIINKPPFILLLLIFSWSLSREGLITQSKNNEFFFECKFNWLNLIYSDNRNNSDSNNDNINNNNNKNYDNNNDDNNSNDNNSN